MIPRFFVSSTYYDLKHVRERLEKFIENYGFEPILFESDKVVYQHGREIDQSAYFEINLCHIMVLIVGGRYGAPSSLSKVEEERKNYDEDYISITRKEFETASNKNMPILIFVDKNVHSEYQTYKENQDFFDNLYAQKSTQETEFKMFKFAHVDHVNVFKFIDLIRVKPIKTFERVEEIENYIKSQLSGMFYLYLESLKKSSEDNRILDTIAELNNVTLRMNEMLTSVGKEILGEDKQEYEAVIENQFEILADFYMEKMVSNLAFEETLDDDKLNLIDFNKVAKIFYEKVLDLSIPKVYLDYKDKEWDIKYREINSNIFADLQNALLKISNNLTIQRVNIRILNSDFLRKVRPFIKTTAHKDKILKLIEGVVKLKLSDLPF